MYEKKPWLKYYDSHTPESIDYPKTIYEVVYDASIKNPDGIAYDFLDYTSNL